MKNFLTKAGATFGLAALLSAGVFAQTGASGQGGPSAGQGQQQRSERRGLRGGRGMAFRHLNLTEAQQQQLRAIRERHAQSLSGQRAEMRQLMQARRQGTLTAEQQARLEALRAQQHAVSEQICNEMLAVLTAEQRAQLEQLRQQGAERGRRGHGRRAGRMHGPRGGFGGGGLRGLNLTETQQQQIRAIHERYSQTLAPQRQELRQLMQARRQGALTAEQQARAEALRNELRQTGERIHAEVLNVLTPEQRTQLEQRRQQREQRREQFRQRRGGPRPGVTSTSL